MEQKLIPIISTRPLAAAAVAASLLLLLAAAPPAAGQQQGSGSGSPAAAGPASCPASLLTSFTPCFSFLTSSSGGSPTRDCCRSLAALMDASAGCACLVLTGAVPLGLGAPTVNRTLAVSLPRACNATAVPLQCRDTSTQTPAAAGPVAADAPSQQLSPPLPTPEGEAPAPPAETTVPPVSQGQTRPMVLPSSGGRASAHVPGAAAIALLLAAAGAALA